MLFSSYTSLLFCSFLLCAIVYAEFVVIFAFTLHREMILNSTKSKNHIGIKEEIYKHTIVDLIIFIISQAERTN